MVFTIFTFLSVLVLFASGGLLLFDRKEAGDSMATTWTARTGPVSLLEQLRRSAVSLGKGIGRLENLLPKSKVEVTGVQRRLMRAGYREQSAVSIFYGSKIVAMVALACLVLVTGLASRSSFYLLGALGLGYIAPGFWLDRMVLRRRKQIRRDLPDLLDLLIVCIEAGLSLDLAVQRTVTELGKSKSAISDELGVVVLEQRAGCSRTEAWKHLADRTSVDSVRSVVSMLVQSERFGTSIAKTLRVHSEQLRTKRIQEVEEVAAKGTIKMLVPLVLFIFPAIFVVTLGPAIISMLESFKTINH
jgi:tight adherence protein C